MGMISARTLRTCPRLNLSSCGLISLAEEMSNNLIFCHVVIRNHSYTGLQWQKNRAERKTKLQIRKKRDTGYLNVTAKACAARESVIVKILTIRKGPDLQRNKHHQARPHPAKCVTCERKRPNKFSRKKQNRNWKCDLKGPGFIVSCWPNLAVSCWLQSHEGCKQRNYGLFCSKRASEAKCAAEESLPGGRERPFGEAWAALDTPKC